MSDTIQYLSKIVDRDWEMLGVAEKRSAGSGEEEARSTSGGGANDSLSSPRASVQEIWRKPSGDEESTNLSCEDVIERSESFMADKKNDVSLALESAGDQSEASDYRLFEPLRSHIEIGSRQVYKSLSSVFGSQKDLQSALCSPKLVNEKTMLSLGALNILLSLALFQSQRKNQNLSSELQKRGNVIHKLISKLYQMSLSYNTVPTMQPHLLEVTWQHIY